MYYNPTLTWALRAILALGAAATLYYWLILPDSFEIVFAREDGIVEYATALFLFFACFTLIGHARRNSGRVAILLGVYALAFFFAAGEEVSWGQRIFGIESTEFFTENNYQGETNLHNLVVGDIHLAEEVFGNALTLVLLSYLVILPLLYPYARWVRTFCEYLAVPAPPRHMAALAVLWSVFIASIPLPRNWEVYEFAFSVFALLIFLNPVNKKTFWR
ncbi:MAG: hypothetical protein ABJL99_16145 [Aliishimia sp.]